MTGTIDSEKRRYSQELAAYTLEQWRLARRQMQIAQAAAAASTDTQNSTNCNDLSDSEENVVDPNLKTIDYANKAPAINGSS